MSALTAPLLIKKEVVRLKAWQKIALVVGAGLTAAYINVRGTQDIDYIRQDWVQSAQTSSEEQGLLNSIVEQSPGSGCACAKQDYSFICNCPAVVEKDCPEPDCPPVDCPTCPEPQQLTPENCETVEQAINRIIANEEHYTRLIRRLVEEHPCLVIEYLPREFRSELGKEYLKDTFGRGYHKISRKMRRWMRDGEDYFERW